MGAVLGFSFFTARNELSFLPMVAAPASLRVRAVTTGAGHIALAKTERSFF